MSLMDSAQGYIGAKSYSLLSSFQSLSGLYTRHGLDTETLLQPEDRHKMEGTLGVDGVVAVVGAAMILLILHHLIQGGANSTPQEEDRLLHKRAGDLGSGVGLWEVLLLDIWLGIGGNDNSKHRPQDPAAGLVEILEIRATLGVVVRVLVRARVQDLRAGTKVLDLAQHHVDDSYSISKSSGIDGRNISFASKGLRYQDEKAYLTMLFKDLPKLAGSVKSRAASRIS